MQSASKITYSYKVTTGSEGAAAHVVGLTLDHKGTSQKILEIGPGPGSILKTLAAEGCQNIFAIERESSFCDILKTITPHVIMGDLNDPTWPNLLNAQKFDTIIAADVLEHLLDPLETLRAMSRQILPGGCIILSLPHVSHAGVMAALWHEDFAYQKTGLLDETHLKFFGIKNIQNLVERAGMMIEHAEFIQRPPEKTEFAHIWDHTPVAVRNAFLTNRFAQVYQVVLRIKPGKNEVNLMTLPLADCHLSLARKLAARYRRWKRSMKTKK